MTRSKDLRDPGLPLYASRFCQLILQGTSEKAQAQRVEGLAFHQQRAVAARKGRNSQALWWAVLLALAAAALLLMKLLVMSR